MIGRKRTGTPRGSLGRALFRAALRSTAKSTIMMLFF
jgi:hypothetical protein